MSKELIKETEFVKLFYEKEFELIAAQWLPETEDMEEEEFKEQNLILIEITKQYLPKKWLADLREFFYTIEPKLQAWAAETAGATYTVTGLKKMAYLMKEMPEQAEEELDIDFERLAVEQLAEEVKQGFEGQFFTSEEESREWLLTH